MFQTMRISIMIVFFSLILTISGCTKEEFKSHIEPSFIEPVFEISDEIAGKLIASAGGGNFFSVGVVYNNNGRPDFFSRENREIKQPPPPTSVKGINNITSIAIARVEVNNRSCQYINLNGVSQVICELQSSPPTKPGKGDIPTTAANLFASKGRKPGNNRKVASVVLIDPDSGKPKLLKNEKYEAIQFQPTDFGTLKNNTTTYTVIHYTNSPGCAWTNVNGREVFDCTK